MTRLISGVALAAAALAAILFLPASMLLWVAVAIAGLAAHEYVAIAGGGRAISRYLVLLFTMVACLLTARGLSAVPPVYIVLPLLAWVALEVLFLGETIQRAGASVVAPLYIGVPLGMLVAVHAAHGYAATLLLLATVVISDSGQYYTGRAFGRRPLAPTISPKKTIEGAVGGVVLGTAFFVAATLYLFPALGLQRAIVLGLAIVVLGICGDLFESRLKRTAGLKDSSALIPGHGGVLDRIDALLFAVPAFYVHSWALA